MRTSSAVVVTLALSGSVLAQAPKPVVPDDVVGNLRARVESGAIPGIVVGIVSPGGETYFSVGVREFGKPGNIDEDTIFEIGSITKAFTGILLADMARKGEVALDDPVAKYLPAEAAPPREGERRITLLDLATQRSGLPRLPDNMAPASPADPYVDYTPERLFAFLPKAKLENPIGSTYLYSNLGVGLLGHALARAAKSEYGTLVRERIAAPLGMTVTSLETDPSLAPRVARGHDTSGATPTPVPAWTWNKTSSLAGAGGLRSTAREMLRFVGANAGLGESKLSGALADASRERAEAGSPRMGIGLGWHIRKSDAGALVWHNGGTGGFHSFCAFDPATKTGVVVLANGNGNIDDVGIHLLDPTVPLQEPRKARVEVQVEPALLAEYAGRYAFAPGVVLDCVVETGRLACQLTGQGRFPVYAESPSVFFYRVVDATLTFTRDDAGKVDAVMLKQGGVQQKAPRMP